MTPTPKVCFDRVLPRDLMRFQTTVPDRPGQVRGLSPIGKTWINGSTLHVRFLGGTAAQKKIVQEQAAWWAAHANLRFVFDDAAEAEIRIAFDDNDGAWSYIGTDARSIPANEPTMNLGFLDGGTAAHEFGHAIGLAHEHQNPAGGIQWNEQAVIRAMAGPPEPLERGADPPQHPAQVRRQPGQRHGVRSKVGDAVLLSCGMDPQWRGDLAQRGVVRSRQAVHRGRERCIRARSRASRARSPSSR